MEKKKDIFVITHHDLDGVVSYLIVNWFMRGVNIGVLPIALSRMRDDLVKWISKHNFEDFEKVFILDLDVSECADLVDHKNVIIIDHHKTHVDNKKYKYAKPLIKEYSSACMLVYKILHKLFPDVKLTKEQKLLLIYGDDYDSYTKNFPESSQLDIVFWNTQKSFNSFIENFKDGFNGFTDQQKNIIKFYLKNLESEIESLELFEGCYEDEKGKNRKIIATQISESNPNDIVDHIFKTHTHDMCITINTLTKRISLRRSKHSDMRVNDFAIKYINGGGHEDAAGGEITDEFLEFTKKLKKIDV